MVELRNLSFSYDTRPLLRNLNLVVEERDFLGIVGGNGCGKTTLVKIILGLLTPQSGEVVFLCDGQRVSRLAMGYLPQYSQIDRLFPITVRETVELGLVAPGNLLSFSGNNDAGLVDEAMNSLGVSSLAGKHIGELSGGELQRVMLARAMVSKPQLLVLDEPGTYLDSRSEVNLYELLVQLNRKCAIILIGHDIDNIRNYAKRIVTLDALMS